MNVAAFKAFRRADSFDKYEGRLATWFMTIAINAALDIIKGEWKHRHKDLEYNDPFNPAMWDAPEVDAPNDKAQKRRVIDLQEVIRSKLTAAEREVIEADKISGNGKADDAWLAQKTGRSKSTIQVLRSKARKKIRESMIEKGHYQSTQKGKS